MAATENFPSPKPIIDNIKYLENPFRQHHFSAKPFLSHVVENADLDLEFSLKFLYSYNGSSATFNSYRRELERILQWAWHVERRSIIDLKRENIEEFISFVNSLQSLGLAQRMLPDLLAKMALEFRTLNGDHLLHRYLKLNTPKALRLTLITTIFLRLQLKPCLPHCRHFTNISFKKV